MNEKLHKFVTFVNFLIKKFATLNSDALAYYHMAVACYLVN